MKIMSRRNGGDSVNNESAGRGRVVYQVTTIPEWHNFHITETQFYYSVYYIPSTDVSIKNEERKGLLTTPPPTAPTIKWCIVIIT